MAIEKKRNPRKKCYVCKTFSTDFVIADLKDKQLRIAVCLYCAGCIFDAWIEEEPKTKTK